MTNVTFFAWGDMHFGYEQKFYADDLRGKIIRQMNELPGWPFPNKIGGIVSEPDFVAACGDMVDSEPEADEQYELDIYKYFSKKLKFKQYEVLGNHDTRELFSKYFLDKYHSKSYSFDLQGIHFISLNSDYDLHETGHISDADLQWLKNDLKQLGPLDKVVIFTHTRIDSLKNTSQLLKVLKKNNVILIVSAHKHKPEVFECENISCISIGHCRNHPIDPEYGRNFYVIRIQENRIVAVPWRWDIMSWEQGQRWNNSHKAACKFILDKTI